MGGAAEGPLDGLVAIGDERSHEETPVLTDRQGQIRIGFAQHHADTARQAAVFEQGTSDIRVAVCGRVGCEGQTGDSAAKPRGHGDGSCGLQISEHQDSFRGRTANKLSVVHPLIVTFAPRCV